MEVFASYIPVVLIVLAIIASYWRTSTQLRVIMMNMVTKDDIRDLKDEFRDLRNEMKDMKNDI